MGMNLILLTTASWYMTGLIWMVQLVHYPSFRYIDPTQFKTFNYFHQAKTTTAVVIVMILELVTAFLGIFYAYINQSHLLLYSIVAILTLCLWLLTMLVFVPLHEKLLAHEKDLKTIDQLVKKNRWRAILWSLKSLILAYLSFKLYQR